MEKMIAANNPMTPHDPHTAFYVMLFFVLLIMGVEAWHWWKDRK